jgi:hypothetical protein
VVEAETAQVILPSANAPLRDIGVLWSAGWQLRFPAQEAGYIAEIDVDVPAGQWHLCAGLTRGPQYGNWEVSVNGQGGGLLAGFAPQPGVLDWLKVGKLKGANGKTRLRFVCTGRDPKATGSHLGLDYVGWQRIVVEDALEGETAEVVDIRDGRRTDQLLGERFSGGNHLWFHPQKIGASFTWLLDVPEDGTYQLVVYFTKSWDYAIVSLSLDGKALGEFDTYAPAVTWAGPTQMGSAQLTRGKHRLTFEVKGRNEQSKGILVGVDCLTLKKR